MDQELTSLIAEYRAFDNTGIFHYSAIELKKIEIADCLLRTLGIPEPMQLADPESPDEKPVPGFVYVMRNDHNGEVKIGWSSNPQKRHEQLKFQCKERAISLVFSFLGTRKHEEALHRKYGHKRLRGEWFDLNDSEINDIRMYGERIQ